MSDSNLKNDFLASLRKNEIGDMLIAYLPDVYFFVKDLQGRFIFTSRSFWEKMGCTSEQGIEGLTDFDIFPRAQAEGYVNDDAAVMRTGYPQINKLELIPTADGLVDWYHTTKAPLLGRDGNIVGLAGITRDLRLANSALQPYRTLEPVIRFILKNYSQSIPTSQLAKIANLSLPRFTRRFKREFRVTPSRYLMVVRLNAACRMLGNKKKSISDIALETGFYDHSFFTKQFVKYKGMTPKEFRRRFDTLSEQSRFLPLTPGRPEEFENPPSTV